MNQAWRFARWAGVLTQVCITAWALPGLAQQAGAGAGGGLPDEPNWRAVCAEVVQAPLPSAAQALADAAARQPVAANLPAFPLDGCDAEAEYYGYGGPGAGGPNFHLHPRYAAALKCGYLQREHPTPQFGDSFEGPGVLAMLYANGYGVPRDTTLALRFACEVKLAAGAEMEGRIGRLEALRDGKLPKKPPFDLCDDATSGGMGGHCEEIAQNLADSGRRRRLAVAQAKLPARAQAMLPGLEQAERTLEQVRGTQEYTGGGGSGAGGFRLLDQGQLREQFVINLERFAKGDLPAASPAERRKTEAELARVYAAAETAPVETYPGAVQPQGVAATQEAWRRLFAEWMRFVPVAYPGLSVGAVAVELERLRTHQLLKLSPAG